MGQAGRQPLASGIVGTIASVNPVLERLPFISISGNAYRYNREEQLPGVAFRGVNAAYPESTGVINPETEALTIVGGDSDFDVALVRMGAGSQDIRAVHDTMKAKSLSVTWLKTFFDGDNGSEPREFDGLNRRLTGVQVVDSGAPGGATLTLDLLDELVDAVQGTPSVLLMNKTMRRKVTRLAGDLATVGLDELGRPVTSYGGVPIGIVEDDASGDPILGFDEDDGSGNADTAADSGERDQPFRPKVITDSGRS